MSEKARCLSDLLSDRASLLIVYTSLIASPEVGRCFIEIKEKSSEGCSIKEKVVTWAFLDVRLFLHPGPGSSLGRSSLRDTHQPHRCGCDDPNKLCQGGQYLYSSRV